MVPLYMDHKWFLPQPSRVPSPVAAHISKRERKLTKKFSKRLEEEVQLLMAEKKIQQGAFDIMNEQLKMLQDSKLQVRGQFRVNGRRNRRKGQPSRSQSIGPAFVVTAAAPGQHRTSRVIFIWELGFALFILVAGAEKGPAGLWQWKMLFIYKARTSGGLAYVQSHSMPSMSCALRKGMAPE